MIKLRLVTDSGRGETTVMAYRRKSETTTYRRHFHDFLHDNRDLMHEIGLPSFVIEDYNHFIYFLMHGDTWPHAPFWFGIQSFSQEKRQMYLLMLHRYLEAGCEYPGLGGLTADEQAELEQTHEAAFASGRRRNPSGR